MATLQNCYMELYYNMESCYEEHRLLVRAKTKVVIIQQKNWLITMNNELVDIDITTLDVTCSVCLIKFSVF